MALPIADRPGAHAETLGPMFRGHGDVLLALGDGAGAESAFRRALELDRSIARPPTPGYRGTAMLLLALANACAAQGKRDDAERYFELAEVEYVRVGGQDSSDVATVWEAWALFCRATGRHRRAHELEREALRVYRETAEALRANGPSAAGCARFDALVAAIEARLAEPWVARE